MTFPTETRRALLQTLSPLLTQAENVRKNDQEIIEDFTRCNIERVRHKDYGYQYTDIDNGNYVAPSEYEKRYKILSVIQSNNLRSKKYYSIKKNEGKIISKKEIK